MDENLIAAITAAVQAYIQAEEKEKKKRFGSVVSPWKMGARRDLMNRRLITDRRNPYRVRPRRFSLL